MSDLYRRFGSTIKALPNPFSSTWYWFKNAIGAFLDKLTVAQKLYFLAFVFVVGTDTFTWVAILTVLGLSIEFWPVFERIWHSLAGKAVLLLFYAIVANFALGWAAGIVNDVAGVPASHLSYTHNMALLLYIPAWFVLITALAILAIQLVVPFYLILILMLKPLGITLPRLTQNEHFRKTTLLVRLVLASTLLFYLVLYIVPEINEDDIGSNVENTINGQVSDINIGIDLTEQLAPGDAALQQAAQLLAEAQEDVKAQRQAGNSRQDVDAESSDPSLIEELTNGVVQVSEPTTTDEQELELIEQQANTREKYQKFVRKMVAQFAYNLEADSKSRCEKAEESKVVELNDYEILEIFTDRDAADGFRFEVKPCVSPAFPAMKAGQFTTN
ncbi:hypothetical protein FLM48_00595 [Shewanella sp. Scap07]|uniref:hypothetical protein n=1 Tax=Shewanella sp. Scap07 TaxID=2589987 RepID=UPI0015BB477C|nr:hypothetical protein [Shewanella sp. Scap07]QLE83718.1 hypothetical protein FLM48_00595 [Shewanella sp. Scap07]